MRSVAAQGFLAPSTTRLMAEQEPNIGIKTDSPSDMSSSESAGPTLPNKILAGGGLVLSALSARILKDDLAPSKPRWTEPNSLDIAMRDWFKWRKTGTADTLSDILLGIFASSVFLTPLHDRDDYDRRLLIRAEILALNGMLSQTVKFAVGRQRPYSYFNEAPRRKGGDEYLSFYSGHSSTSFAIATSTAYLLSDAKDNNLWWLVLIPAATTGWLRIAADKHYFTDVVVGAFVGSAIGYFIAHQRSKDWLKSTPRTPKSTTETRLVISKIILF